MTRTVKYTDKVNCDKCGLLMFDGQGEYSLPIGFGADKQGNFVVDKMVYEGWVGECACRVKWVAYKTKKLKRVIVKTKKELKGAK